MGLRADFVITVATKDLPKLKAVLDELIFQNSFTPDDVAEYGDKSTLYLEQQRTELADTIGYKLRDAEVEAVISCTNCNDVDQENWSVIVGQNADGEFIVTEESQSSRVLGDAMKGLLKTIEDENLNVDQIKAKIKTMI